MVPSKEDPARHPPKYLAAGRVLRPHGVRGEVIIEGEARLIGALGPGDTLFLGEARTARRVVTLRPHKKRYIVQFEGYQDRDAADGLRGQSVYLSLEDLGPLPEGEYYTWQIIGLQVFEPNGAPLGVVESILETGANDVYLVRDEEGEELLLPAIEGVILEVDLESGRLVVRIPPGLIPGR